MSTLESVIWHILGYLAMPMIFLSGFAAVAVACIFILRISGVKTVDEESS